MFSLEIDFFARDFNVQRISMQRCACQSAILICSDSTGNHHKCACLLNNCGQNKDIQRIDCVTIDAKDMRDCIKPGITCDEHLFDWVIFGDFFFCICSWW